MTTDPVTRSVEIPEAAVRSVAGGLERLTWVGPAARTEAARELLAAALPYLAPAEPSHQRVEQVLRERLLNSNFSSDLHEPLRTQAVDQWVDVLAGALFHAGLFAAPAGDGGLREALERKLATTDGWAVANETLLAMLAAHPAAPAVPRPVDREALEQAIGTATGHVCEMDQHEEGEWEAGCTACAGWGYPCAPLSAAVDAVLAVLAGEQEQARG